MSKMKISEYFNPEQHLTLHQDKEGNMIGGGYQVNNLLYQRKMPLFVSLGSSGGGQGAMSGGAEAGAGRGAALEAMIVKIATLFLKSSATYFVI